MKHAWHYTGYTDTKAEPTLYEVYCNQCKTNRFHERWGEEGSEAFFAHDFACHPRYGYESLGQLSGACWD